MASNPYAGFLPKSETLCLTRAANLQKILRHEEREREKGGGGEKRDERKWEEEKKEGEGLSHENRREEINMVQ